MVNYAQIDFMLNKVDQITSVKFISVLFLELLWMQELVSIDLR